MNKYIAQSIIALIIMIPYYAYGMESKQHIVEPKIVQNGVERAMIRKALSTISFEKNERILQLGNYRRNIHNKKSLGMRIYDIDTDTLNTIKEAALTYDKILSLTCWNILKKSPEIFQKSIYLLKHNGQIRMVVPYYKSPYLEIYNQTIADKKWQGRGDFPPIQYFSRKAIKSLNISGKINIECERIKKPFTFKNSKRFKKWVEASIQQFLEKISWWYHKELAQDVALNYLKKYPLGADKSVKLYFSYIVVKGTKL